MKRNNENVIEVEIDDERVGIEFAEGILREYEWILQPLAVVCNKLADAGDGKSLFVLVQSVMTTLKLSNARLKVSMGKDEGKLN